MTRRPGVPNRRPGIRLEPGQIWRAENGSERTILKVFPAAPGQPAAVQISRPNGTGGQIEVVMTEQSVKTWIYTQRAEIPDAG